MSSYQERPDSFLVFSKAERIVILLSIAVGFCLCLSGYWLPKGETRDDKNTSEFAELESQFSAWVARAELEEDSLEAAKYARQQASANRFDRPSTSVNRYEKYESPIERTSSFMKNKSQAVRIDYSIALPRVGSQDPNSIDSAGILRLGVPRDIMLRWLKFRSRGGTFVKRSDISKLYGLEDSTFKRISTYFIDGSDLEAGFEAPRPRGEFLMDPVEVNMATIEELKKIKGIGNFYAKQITEYREKLGGFIRVEQIAETPKLRDSTFQAVKRFMRVDPTELVLIPINRVDDKRLARHPYISASKAKTLFAFRQNHGPYRGVQDLYKTEVLDSALIASILPYLSFD